MLYASRSYPDVLTRLSFSTAWPALILLTLTLLIGPWRQLKGKTSALSLDLRRDIGIWAGIVGLLHTGIGQCVHLRGRPWLYYVYEKWGEHAVPLRHDIFGLSNFTGLFAALILLAPWATPPGKACSAGITPALRSQRLTPLAISSELRA